jgi:hypothetical protein
MIATYQPDGTVHLNPTTADLAAVNDAVGEPGMAIVRLHEQHNLMGFVNDTGHMIGLERNVPGSLILVALGAGMQPYAGPVVITGWDWTATARDRSEICDLTDTTIFRLGVIAAAVQATICDDRRALPGSIWKHAGAILGVGFPADMADRMRNYATLVHTAPTPQIEILHDDDALAYLERALGRAAER